MPDYNALIVIDQQGEIMRVKSGGDVKVKSGGKITVESGGEIDNTAGAKTVNKAILAVDTTLTREDSGKTFVVTAADKVMTLPATVAGLEYTFVLAAAALSSGTGLSISPQAVDSIRGNGFTAADNKDAINSGGSDVEGDLLTVVGDGVIGWYITNVLGTWAREG